MTRKGVLVSVNSDSAELARRLNTEAAKSMKWGGLTEDEALRAGHDQSGEAASDRQRASARSKLGKDADIVVWNHHPLSTYAIADRVYIDGTLYYDRIAEDKRLTDARSGESGPDGRRKRHPASGNWSRTARCRGYAGARSPTFREYASASAAQTPTGTVWAITNATIHPMNGPDIARGTIVIRGSKIEAVGANVQVPAGAQTVDAGGEDVYPGFINARTQMGLNEPGPRGFEDVNEMLDYNPQLRTRVAYHVESDTIPVTRANGITTVALVPCGGIFGGEVAVMNLDGWTWEDATLSPNAGIEFNFPLIGGGGGRGGGGGGGGRFGARTAPFDQMKKQRDDRLDEISQHVRSRRAPTGKPGPTSRRIWCSRRSCRSSKGACRC